MKTLLLLRHAKSSWDEPDLPDHDRPLTERGKRDARRVGTLLQERDLVPDLIVSSTAKRALKTALKVARACGIDEEIQTTGRLYEAYPTQFLEVLRELEDRFATVLLVAHNPGLEGLVWHLTGQRESLPTAALAQVALTLDRWQDLQVPPGGQLVQVWRPKEDT